jgi:hypothetical protein
MKKWHSETGEIKLISEIDHQHLSNIIWFDKIFKCFNNIGSVYLELLNRFNNELLPYKPLPITNEIMNLRELNMVDKHNNIIFENKIIGNLNHL